VVPLKIRRIQTGAYQKQKHKVELKVKEPPLQQRKRKQGVKERQS